MKSPSSPPGDTIRDLLSERDLYQADLARALRRPLKTINEIVKGKTIITAITALQLEKFFGVDAQFWLYREANYQLYLARKRKKR